MAKPNEKRVMSDLEKLEVVQKEAAASKPLIGAKVKVKKGVNEGKTGVIKTMLIDRMHLRFNVLLDGRSPDDPFGWEPTGLRGLVILDPALAAQYGKVARVKDPTKALKAGMNNAIKAIRVAMKAGKAVDAALATTITTAVAEWNKAPGAPTVTKKYGKAAKK